MGKKLESQIKNEILNALKEEPFGLTIFELSERTNRSRNTISTYVKEKMRDIIDHKSVGNYTLYFLKEESFEDVFLKNPILRNFYSSLLIGLQRIFGEQIKLKAKEIGYEISKKISLPIEGELRLRDLQSQKMFDQVFLRRMLINHTKRIEKSDRCVTEVQFLSNGKALLIIKDSIFLKEGAELHYYIQAGVIESKVKQLLNRDFEVNVLEATRTICKMTFEIK